MAEGGPEREEEQIEHRERQVVRRAQKARGRIANPVSTGHRPQMRIDSQRKIGVTTAHTF